MADEKSIFHKMLESIEESINWQICTRNEERTIYRKVEEKYFERISKAQAKSEIREHFRYATPGAIASLCDALIEDPQRMIDDSLFLENREHCIGFQNGVFDLKEGRMRAYRAGDAILEPLPWDVPYKYNHDAEQWFLEQCESWVSADCGSWFMTLLAYLLFIIPNEEQIWVNFFGMGSNGKSLVEQLLEHILGEGKTIGCDLGHINRFSGATFEGKWLIVGRDSSSKVSGAATSLIKTFSGDVKFLVETKGGNSYDALNYGKLLISTNTLVQSSDRTYSWYRRLIPVPFPYRFERNDRYRKQLLSRTPDIIRVLLHKAYLYRTMQIQLSKSLPAPVRDLREDTRLLNDRLAAFWELYFHKRIETLEGIKKEIDYDKLIRFDRIGMSEAYDIYKYWHSEEFPDMPVEPSLRKFGGPYGDFLSTGAGDYLQYKRTNKGRILEVKSLAEMEQEVAEHDIF